MDKPRLGSSSRHIRNGFGLIAVAAITFAMSASTGFFRGGTYIEIDRGSNITWHVDTLGLWNEFVTTKVDSLVGASGTGVTAQALRDSLNELMENGHRLLTESLLNPGSNKQVLQTLSGTAGWVTDPELPDRVAQYFYSTSIEAQNRADTSGNKHVLAISQLAREYPLAYGTSYSSMQAHIYLRTSTLHRSYTSSLVTVGFSGTAALTAGDKVIARFFPGGGVSADKYLRVYRLPEGTNAIGGGSTVIYGEQIGYFVVPASYFPSSGYVNIDVTLSYKVHP